MTKKPIITIEEVLKKPYEMENLPPFRIGENIPVPMFGDAAIEVLADFSKLAHKLLLAEPLVVFWGLSGALGSFYSKVLDPELTMDVLHMKITIAKTVQPFSVLREKAFELLTEKLGGIQGLRDIHFEEAMLVIAGKKPIPQMVYDEPEEESDFDDDCTPECRPGYHKCGK